MRFSFIMMLCRSGEDNCRPEYLVSGKLPMSGCGAIQTEARESTSLVPITRWFRCRSAP